MIKNFILIFLISIFINSAFADTFDIRKVNNAKTFSKANIELNNTNLVDKENAERLLDNVLELNVVLIEEGKKIRKNNKNRKRPKFKGGAEEIYENFSNSVVFIGNRQKGIIKGIGSGFIVNHKGLKIITNWHVIEDAEKISVWLKPDKMVDENFLIRSVDSYSATVVKVNKRKDLAMLSVEGLPTKATAVKYGKFNSIKIGQNAFAIGHPRGLLWTFTSGMISQKRANYNWRYRGSSHSANVIQIQVPINPGNSGGPLFNKNKELIGVNTFTSEGENLNFAIASDDVIDFLNELSKPIKKTTSNSSKYIQKKKKGPTWIKKKKKKTSNNNSVNLSDATEIDVNNNGVVDSWLIDENNNGIYEIAYGDKNEDGVIDIMAIDKNEDNNFEVILIDTNNNGNPDEAEIDENEDGKTDVIAYDYNEDGEWDKYENV